MKTERTFWYNLRRGQTMVEYALALLGVVAVVAVMGYLVAAAASSAERTTEMAKSDYP